MSIKKGIIGFAVSIVARGGASQKAVVEIDPAGPGEKSALTHFIGGQVSGVEVIERAGEKGQLEHFRDALEHIRKTCYQSRTQTRRLRWIIKRVDLVLAGRPYVAAEHSVPVDGISEYHKQKRLAGRYLEERNNYLSIINATMAVFEDDADVVGYIEALLTSTIGPSGTDSHLQARLEVSEDTLKTIRQCLASAEKELDQCGSMAAMVHSREWADTFCTAPVPSAVESAFTQLHNELGAANDRIAELEGQLAESKRTRQRACQLAIGKSQLAKESAAKASLLERQLLLLERVTGIYIPRGQVVDCPPLLKRILAEAKAASGGLVISEFKLPDMRGIYPVDVLGRSGFACLECGGDKRVGAVGNVCQCHVK